MKRIFKFLRRYLFKHPIYVLIYALVFWRKKFALSTSFLTEVEIKKVLREGKSIIRLGDGEINLMLGLNNHYQNFTPVLQKAMFDIVRGYQEDSPYILSIPRFVNYTNDELRKIGKLRVWLPLKVMFTLYFNKNLSYLDAHSFYYDGYFDRTVGQAIKDRQVVLVTKQETIERQQNNSSVPWRKLDFICVPDKESLSSYNKIKSDIEKTIASYDSKKVTLLFAMGPVGKLLAFEYANQGVQSIDIGKVAEVMFTGESIAHIV